MKEVVKELRTTTSALNSNGAVSLISVSVDIIVFFDTNGTFSMSCERETGQSCDSWETWDYGGLDVNRLKVRAVYYARKAGATAPTTGELRNPAGSSA